MSPSRGRRGALHALGAAVAAAAMLAGCATPRPATTPSEREWTTGRISLSVTAAGGRPAQNLAGAFELRGDADEGELRLVTPLGVQLAQARWAPGHVVLNTPGGQRSFASLDELAQATLGERVPLAALPDWVMGRPWSGAPMQWGDSGFEQLGWTVDLRQREAGRIAARRAAPPAVSVRIQLDG